MLKTTSGGSGGALAVGSPRELRANNAPPPKADAAIADELRLTLSPAERTRLAKSHSQNPEAHDAYLRGRFDLGQRDERAPEEQTHRPKKRGVKSTEPAAPVRLNVG